MQRFRVTYLILLNDQYFIRNATDRTLLCWPTEKRNGCICRKLKIANKEKSVRRQDNVTEMFSPPDDVVALEYILLPLAVRVWLRVGARALKASLTHEHA